MRLHVSHVKFNRLKLHIVQMTRENVANLFVKPQIIRIHERIITLLAHEPLRLRLRLRSPFLGPPQRLGESVDLVLRLHQILSDLHQVFVLLHSFSLLLHDIFLFLQHLFGVFHL